MIKSSIVLALFALLGFAGTASAANAAAPEDGNILDLAKPVFEAVMHGQGWLAAALALILCTALARRYLPKLNRFKWVASDAGTTLTAFLMSLGGGFATAFAAGAGPSLAVAKTAFGVALGAAGGYQALKHLVAPVLRALRDKLPAWARPGLDMVLWMFDRPSRNEAAAAAGEAAVKANPAPGVAGLVGEPKDWP